MHVSLECCVRKMRAHTNTRTGTLAIVSREPLERAACRAHATSNVCWYAKTRIRPEPVACKPVWKAPSKLPLPARRSFEVVKLKAALSTREPPRPASSSSAGADGKIKMVFRWPGSLGNPKEVKLCGSWDGWVKSEAMLRSPHNGDFFRTISLDPGVYQYKFLVDEVWKTSPCDPILTDAEGYRNNQRQAVTTATFRWPGNNETREVYVLGDFTGWSDLIQLQKDKTKNEFIADCALMPGPYQYMYVVDEEFRVQPNEGKGEHRGVQVNKVEVRVGSAFHLFYSTGWEDCELVYREREVELAGDEEWKVAPMFNAPSRARPGGGKWKMAVLSAKANLSNLDFYICRVGSRSDTDEEDSLSEARQKRDVDKPSRGEYYTLPHIGGYKLVNGRILPFQRARHPPMLLCADIDGTMIGDTDEADKLTLEFTTYWENQAALVGSVLVYNTGRSLGQFKQLWKEKQDCLALPDVLITAVGTKIWLLKDHSRGHSGKSDEYEWEEDELWSKRLDEGWDLQKVKAVATKIVDHYQQEERVHWLDTGTEHRHRVALSVHVEVVSQVMVSMSTGLKKAGVQARLISSGTGNWRYVDSVAYKAGKYEALDYIRTMYNIPHDRCVAAGDSCNDILMLEGRHPVVVVGNAQAELVEWLVEQEQDGRVIFANAPVAAGVLEGIARHGLY